MAIIAVGSLHGSPGSTLLALDVARFCDGETLLIEADPDGGCLAARLDLALKPGLTELAGAARVGIAADDLWRYAQPSEHGVAVIVAHPAAEQVHAALRAALQHVASSLVALGRDVVIDVGRLRPGSPALAFAGLADHLLIASHNSAEAVVSLTHRAQVLAGLAASVVVLSASKPYPPEEIAMTSGQPVWGVVPPVRGRRSIGRRSRALRDLVALWAPLPVDTAVNSDAGHAESTTAEVDAATADVSTSSPAVARPTESGGERIPEPNAGVSTISAIDSLVTR